MHPGAETTTVYPEQSRGEIRNTIYEILNCLAGIETMDGNQLVQELMTDLSKIKGLTVTNPGISKKNKVFQLSGKLNGFIYVKAIASCRHNWGITINTVDKIKTRKRPWCVILIYESKQTGYIISQDEYREKVGKDLWPRAQGDYKICEGKSLSGVPGFSTVDELVGLLFERLP